MKQQRQTIESNGYLATINPTNDGDWFVLVTRDGQCLPGIMGKHFANIKNAIRGANRMIAKAA